MPERIAYSIDSKLHLNQMGLDKVISTGGITSAIFKFRTTTV